MPGSIVDGVLPTETQEYISQIWFTYCASDYFASNSSAKLVPPPWFSPRELPVMGMSKGIISWRGRDIRFPVSGEFFLTKEAKEYLVKNKQSNRPVDFVAQYLDAIPDDFKVGSLEAVSFISTADGRISDIPEKVYIRQFSFPKPGRKSYVSQLVTLALTGVSEEKLSDYRPTIPEGFTVTPRDARLRDIDQGIPGIMIEIKDQSWPMAPRPNDVLKFKQQRSVAVAPVGSARSFSIMKTVCVFAFVLILPLTMLVVYRRRKRQNMKSLL
jgi:hypothetical protein